jgi:DNA polymerase III subunit epsilon
MRTWATLAMAITVVVVVVLAVIAAYAGVVWHTVDPEHRAALAPIISVYSDTLVLLILMLALAAGLALAPLLKSYVIVPLRLAQDTRLIATANPAHRLAGDAGAQMRELADAINLLAARYESAMQEARTRIEAARRDVEQEKNRLAALMSELTHAVIVCNIEGAVLLYNSAARQLFTRQDVAIDAALLGLGRSVFSLIDRTLFAHTTGRLSEQLRRGVARPVVHFVTTTPSGELLRTQMAPIRGAGGMLDGYILTFTEASVELGSAERREELLLSLVERGRAALANVQTAAEAMNQAADLDTKQRETFVRVIREETDSLAKRLDQAAQAYADEVRGQWPLENMSCADLVALAAQHLEHNLAVKLQAHIADTQVWIRVDSYVMLHVLTRLAQELRDTHDARTLFVRVSVAGRHAELDLGARGIRRPAPVVGDWETRPIAEHGELAGRTVRQVMEKHGGEAWQQFDPATGELYFRLLLPLAEPQCEAPVVERAHESRPEFYDFDLFHQAGLTDALENRALSELAYTVFDTETTGLEPSQGDEIIAIGAVRIVNGRLLPHEAFEQLIDPRRPLSPGSARITGISADMLSGQPTIATVLPRFHRYCAETVLVAHNAAFDMRFLQLKEQTAGVRFTQPVLDTLLLSAVLHPALESHKLEAIAERHGVNVIGRHTALGDAMVTAEIFVRMIPQLAERGIVTLKDAQQAAQRTYYARVRY